MSDIMSIERLDAKLAERDRNRGKGVTCMTRTFTHYGVSP